MGIALCVIAHIRLERVQLFYSIIILFLCSIGLFRTIRQAVEANKREPNIIDNVVDNQIAIKAVRIAENPTKEGEKIGKIFIDIMEVTKSIMKKLKELFDKYKGYLLTIALAVLSVIEDYGGFINQICGGKFVIGGCEVLPLVTLGAAVVVGILSNGYTKEQHEKIKALFNKSSTDEMVKAEIKRTITTKTAKLTEEKRELAKMQTELDNLNAELERKKNTHAAKQAMFAMQPQLATAEDVQTASTEVVNTEAAIANKKADIEKAQNSISALETTINALKSQL